MRSLSILSYKIIFLLIIAFHTGFVSGKNKQLPHVQDSIIEVLQNAKKKLLKKSDSIRFTDSLKQVKLQSEIAGINAPSNSRRRLLVRSLDSLSRERKRKVAKLTSQLDSLRSKNPGFPVVFHDDTLFYIYSKLGPYTPSIRAHNIYNKLQVLVEQGIYSPEKLKVIEGDESHDITHEKIIILSVTKSDAFWLNGSQMELADYYMNNLKDAISSYQRKTGIWVAIKQAFLTILVIIILFLGIKYLNKGFTHLNRKLIEKGSKYLRGVNFKNYEFLSAEQEVEVARWTLKVIKWLAIVFIIYLALPIIFSIFPSTKGIADTLFGYVLSPLKKMTSGLINYIPEIISILVIIMVTKYFIRFLKFMSEEVENGKLQINGFYPDWARPTFNLLKIIVYAFAFVVIFPYLPGSDSTAFQGVSVFLGLLISLGSTSVIGNMLAGLVITYMRAFKIGDRVKIGDVTGDVIEKSMFVIRIRTIKNEDVTIPNSAVLAGNTKNYSSNAKDLGLILNTTVTIGYDVPWEKVHKLLIDAALKTEHIKAEPSPFVLQTSLDDFYVSYQINATTEEASTASKIYSQLHSNIQMVFNEAGVEILSPHYRAGRDGNITTIPRNFLPADYEAPSFNVKVKKD